MSLVNGLLMNSVNNQPVFVQVIFNADTEILTLLLVIDFTKLEMMQVDLDKVDHPLWNMIFLRFGSSNSAIVMKINTVMMSYEFHLFIQLIIDGVIEPADYQQHSVLESEYKMEKTLIQTPIKLATIGKRKSSNPSSKKRSTEKKGIRSMGITSRPDSRQSEGIR